MSNMQKKSLSLSLSLQEQALSKLVAMDVKIFMEKLRIQYIIFIQFSINDLKFSILNFSILIIFNIRRYNI